MKGKSLMLMGTASSVGKSTLCAALLRIFKQDGLRVAPFKAQNMSLNAFATKEGLEMGRAQVTQAEAAGIEPRVSMNPVLLKPTSDHKSQVIINGKSIGTMSAADYERFKPQLRTMIKETYDALEQAYDAVVIEGAGSPAEINLMAGDIVNMSMARAANAPVLLIGDINPGGVFASLYGTVKLLPPEDQARIKGIIINKFRGDVSILAPGLDMIEDLLDIPVLGVVPWTNIDMEDEDSVTERFEQRHGTGPVHVVILRLPHISNFTDFALLAKEENVTVSYTTHVSDVENADIILLPGTKNTIEDLLWLRKYGLAEAILRAASRNALVFGLCGGYQMLGNHLYDPLHIESDIPEIAGLGLLDFSVTFHEEKTTVQSQGTLHCSQGWMQELNDLPLTGYEIHNGKNTFGDIVPFLSLNGQPEPGGIMNRQGNVLGSYLHGIFDTGMFWQGIVRHVLAEKGINASHAVPMTIEAFREQEFDRLAAIVRQSLDMDQVYRILRGEPLKRRPHG